MRILIVDDHTLFLQGISTVLEQHFPAATLETYQQISEAFDALKTNPQADLVLADIYMPKIKGLSLMELLAKEEIFVPILLVSATEDFHLIKHCLDLGASGFVHKSSRTKELLHAIQNVLEKGMYLDKKLAKKLSKTQDNLLSKRQNEVLSLLAEGLTNRQIGEALGISEVTIKSHISALFDFFGANNRLDCIRKAEKIGMVSNNNDYL